MRMKRMLLGIFLMLCSIWCLIFGAAANVSTLVVVSLVLALAALVSFIGGFFTAGPEKRDREN